MKTNLGDAKSQQGQKYCWSYFSDPLLNFLIRSELSHVAPPPARPRTAVWGVS